MTLRCLFSHATHLVTDGDEGRIVCKRCQAVLDRWPLLRPEQVIAEERQHAAVMAERERRAEQMAMPARGRVLRISR